MSGASTLRQLTTVAVALAWSADARQRWRQASVVSAALALTFAVAAGIGFVRAGERVDVTDWGRRAVYAENDQDAAIWVSLRAEIWDGRQFPVIWLAGDADSPLPPGLAELPEPGHVAVSAAIVEHPEVIEALGFEVSAAGTGADGAIGDEGLLSASEWWVYASPPQGRTLGEGGALIPVAGFGAEPGAPQAMAFDTDRSAPGRTESMLLAGVFLVFPALLLAWSCARSHSELRTRRAVSLHRIGLTLSQVRLLGAIETLALALPGALAGVAVAAFVLPHVRSIPLTGLSLHEGALIVPAEVWPALVVAVVLSMVAMSSTTTLVRTGTTPTARSAGASSWRMIPLLAGLAVMVLGKATSGPTALLLLIGGALLVVLTLPWTLPVLVHRGGTLLARLGRPAAWLAGQRMAYSPRRLGQPAVILGVLVFLLGGVTGLATSTYEDLSDAGAGQDVFWLSWRDPRPGDADLVATRLDGAVVLPVIDETVRASSCEDLARLIAEPTAICTDNPSAVVATATARLGVEVSLVDERGESTEVGLVDTVLIGGRVDLTHADIWAATNAVLPAVNLTSALAEEVREPLLVSWLAGAVTIAGLLLAAAASHSYGNRLMVLGQENERMLRLGVDADHVAAVQRWTALAPLTLAITAGTVGALVFSWSGVPEDLTGFPAWTILGEAAIIATVSGSVAIFVGLQQRRKQGVLG